LITEQRRECLLVVPARDPLEVEPGDQLLDAARALEIRRQQAGAEAGPATAAVVHLRHPYLDLSDSSLHRALGQIAVAHHRTATVLQTLLGKAVQEAG
jgi:hypothetical protein